MSESTTQLSDTPIQIVDRPVRRRSGRLFRLVHRLAYQTWNNPIVIKELRGRMRGWRAAVVLIVHLLLMSCFASFIYFVVAESTTSGGSGAVGQTIGQALFYSSYLMLLVVVVFLSPAFTAGAISGERERQTLDLLMTTLLPTHSLVVGKLISSLAYIGLLILAALPIQSLAFVFGGVILPELLIGTLLLFVTALISGTVGLFISSLIKSSIASTVITYAVILLTTMGLPVVAGITLGFLNSMLNSLMSNLGWIGELLLLYGGGFLLCTNPFATAITTKIVEEEHKSLFFFTVNISSGSVSFNAPVVSPWVVYTLFYGVCSALLILISVLILRRKRG